MWNCWTQTENQEIIHVLWWKESLITLRPLQFSWQRQRAIDLKVWKLNCNWEQPLRLPSSKQSNYLQKAPIENNDCNWDISTIFSSTQTASIEKIALWHCLASAETWRMAVGGGWLAAVDLWWRLAAVYHWWLSCKLAAAQRSTCMRRDWGQILDLWAKSEVKMYITEAQWGPSKSCGTVNHSVYF